jgi:chromosome segregation ATPase
MTNRAEERLVELQKEYEAGQKMLSELEAKRQSVQATLLRIEGAMQVLRELLEHAEAQGGK